MDIEQRVDQIFDRLVAIRRDFHAHPELSGNEARTSQQICQYLEQWGIEYRDGVADTGVVAIIRGGRPGKTVAARADIDALPLTEENQHPYKSQNSGVMHACGHDIHTTVLLGTALLLKEMEAELPGTVKLFFQPAEENIGGAERMIADGCMTAPDVDYVIGLHVTPAQDAGCIELKYGKLTANQDKVNITVMGKSGHGAAPDQAVDAIYIAADIVTSLQSLVSRNISPLNPVAFTIGTIVGGTKNSIIADQVVMSGTLRTLDEATRTFAQNKIRCISENIAAALGGQCRVEIINGYKAVHNDDRVVDVIRGVAEDLLGKNAVVISEHPAMAAEDFSYYLDHARGAYYHLGCGNKARGITESVHNKNFDVDENCIKVGVCLQVRSLLALAGGE